MTAGSPQTRYGDHASRARIGAIEGAEAAIANTLATW